MRLFRIPTGVYGLALLIFTDVASGQCKNTGICACHCPVCQPEGNCTSCEKGWSGSLQNNCQRRNLAFQQGTFLSKSSDKGRSAVDGDPRSFSRSAEDENPYFTMTLDNTYAIKYLYIDINLGVGKETQHEERWTYIISGIVGVSFLLLTSLVVVIIKKKRDNESLTRQLTDVTYVQTMDENHTNEHLYDCLMPPICSMITKYGASSRSKGALDVSFTVTKWSTIYFRI
ncbi:uncharacterized protein LOC125670775 isoform X4 [Ostrea edulis]|uniref:uncharacterized protein LOC125670775 isoform X4 n=1 Tax=Ostrea edulis TaxID=37623 RepID=UPI0024AF00D2|nr:uncharacterized protein LOC125670775 isoform X4 [Ostrea edulis]